MEVEAARSASTSPPRSRQQPPQSPQSPTLGDAYAYCPTAQQSEEAVEAGTEAGTEAGPEAEVDEEAGGASTVQLPLLQYQPASVPLHRTRTSLSKPRGVPRNTLIQDDIDCASCGGTWPRLSISYNSLATNFTKCFHSNKWCYETSAYKKAAAAAMSGARL